MLFVSRGDSPEVVEFVEEALDEIAVAVEKPAEGWDIDAVRHRLDVGPCAAITKVLSHAVAVISAVGEERLAGTDVIQYVLGALAVMGLPFGELELYGEAVGVDGP